jgi:outer membrane lipoprotein-sorting protein
MRMKLVLAITVIFLVCGGAFAQVGITPFSGDLALKTKKAEDMNGKIYFSGTKMRMDMDSRGHSMIMINDMPGKVSYMLMPQQKMYMEMRLGQQTMHGPKMPDLKSYDPEHPCASQTDMTCEKVGTETVNGRSADKWLFKNTRSGETTTAWIDKKIHFPLKSVTSSGTEMNLTNIQESAPATSLFEIPSGYKKFDMGAMMGGQTQK